MARVDFTIADFETFLYEQRRGSRGRRRLPRATIQGFFDSMLEVRGSGRRLNEVMDRANELLEGHGVEGIAPADTRGIADYVNMGDTYAGTLLYDAEQNAFLLTSWGDFLEHWEQENAEDRDDLIACAACGEYASIHGSFDENTGLCSTCHDAGETYTWVPTPEHPLVVVLRSTADEPVFVHLWDAEFLSLAFSVRLRRGLSASGDLVGGAYEPSIFHLSTPNSDPYTPPGLEEIFEGDTVARVCEVGNRNVDIDSTQYERLLVAFDAFAETGMTHQPVKEFLVAPT